ncbi:MAG: efflux RND transporter periplasmic adaptor subunit [Dokdonella sp.]|uniref:efflux RND transporter periplasmic adaptor subunit n=1 Tax=Dokdonella sp. TaxID=2291710 RepID=UPI0032640A27
MASPSPVTVATVVVRDMPLLANAVGTVEAINSVSIKSLVDGQMDQAFVKDGDTVVLGQALFRIDPRTAESSLHEAQAALARDQAALAQAKSQVDRYAPVAAKHYISADQMEQYRTNLASSAASVKVSQANVASAKLAVGFTDIRSPLAGKIGRILVQPGNLVKANDTSALVVINQIEPIYVTFALPGTLLGRVLSAQKSAPLSLSANIEGIAQPVEGKVAFIDNAVDTTTGTIKLRGEFANVEHLLWPGQLVNVRLTLGTDANAIVVPDRVVQNGPDGPYVFVVKPDRHAEQRTVEVARLVEGDAVIAKGLAAGETVVLDGQLRVENGSALAVSDAAPAP